MVITLLTPWLGIWMGCNCNPEPSCDDPRLWYSPESDEVVHFGCAPPSEGWRLEPFIEEVGVDLDGRLRGPRGVFVTHTADTGFGPLGPLDLRGWITKATGDTSGLGEIPPTGLTADTFGEIPGWDVDSADTALYDTGEPVVGPQRPGPDEPPAAESPGADEPLEETGYEDTGLWEDTGVFDDTAPTGETGLSRLGPTADTGFFETGDTGFVGEEEAQ